MLSMTGYGKSLIRKRKYEIEAEIKSVNSKFIETKFYMSKELSSIENLLRSLIIKVYKRGYFDVRIRYNLLVKPIVKINMMQLTAIKDEIDKVTKLYDSSNIPFEFLLKEYNIIEIKNDVLEQVSFIKDIESAVQVALKNHLQSTMKEGKSVESQIKLSINSISNSINLIERTIPKYRIELYNKMKDRIHSLISQFSDLDLEKRLMQELAFYIDKYEINEELCRIREHINTAKNKIEKNKSDEIGKTLNFIFQEMQREANTLGSKYSNSLSFIHILKVKEEIEKCREIVQNVM